MSCYPKRASVFSTGRQYMGFQLLLANTYFRNPCFFFSFFLLFFFFFFPGKKGQKHILQKISATSQNFSAQCQLNRYQQTSLSHLLSLFYNWPFSLTHYSESIQTGISFYEPLITISSRHTNLFLESHRPDEKTNIFSSHLPT